MVYQRILNTDLKQNLKQNPETESETLTETIVRQGPENKAAAKIHCHIYIYIYTHESYHLAHRDDEITSPDFP